MAATELGVAYFSLVPTATGITANVGKQLAGVPPVASAAGAKAGKGFGSSFMGPIKSTAKLAGVTLGIVGAFKFFTGAIKDAEAFQKGLAGTKQVIKSTGGVAGITAKQVGDLALKLSAQTGITGGAVRGVENLLLTFTSVRNQVGKGNDIFNQATGTILDMSVAMKMDFRSAALQVGKALQDPVKGMASLRRVGVAFTPVQEKMVKDMVASGHTMEAQKFILRELKTEFGGQAAAQGNAADKMKASWARLSTQVGNVLLPAITKLENFLTDKVIPAISNTVKWVSANVHWLGPLVGILGSAFVAFKMASMGVALFNAVLNTNPIILIVTALIALGVGLYLAYQKVGWFRNAVQTAFRIIQTVISVAADIIRTTWEYIQAFWHGAVTAFNAVARAISTAIGAIVSAWNGVVTAFNAVAGAIGAAINVIVAVFRVFGAIAQWVWTYAVSPFITVMKIQFVIVAGIVKVAFAVIVAVFRIYAAVIGVVIEILKPFWQLNLLIFKGLAALVVWAFNVAIMPVVRVFGVLITWLWNSVVSPVFNAIKWLISQVVANIKLQINVAITVFHAVATVIRWLWNSVVSPAFNLIKWIISQVVANIKLQISIAITVFRTIASVIMWLWHNIVQPAMNGVGAAIRGAAGVVHVISDAFSNASAGIRRIGDNIVSFVTGIKNGITGAFSGAGAWLLQAGKNVLQGFLDGLRWIWDKGPGNIIHWISGIASWIKDHKGPISLDRSLLFDAGKAIMGGFFKGLKKGFSGAMGFIKNITGIVWDTITSSPSKAVEFLGKLSGDALSAVGNWVGSLGNFGINTNLASMFGGGTVPPGNAQLTSWAMQAMKIVGVGMDWLLPILRRINFESGGNPNAINLTDSNAMRGDPSRGLMQTVMSTFAAYHQAGTSANIYDPVANIAAAIRYILSRYGSIHAIDPPIQGYASGAWDIAKSQLAYLHAHEMVVPESVANVIRRRGFGAGSTVNVYPQPKQSEYEIGQIAARELAWMAR